MVFVFFDQITKHYILENVKATEPIIVVPNFFEITHVLNPGAAFSFLADKDSSIRHPFFITVISFAILLILYMFFTLKEKEPLVRFSLCLILGGAVGNLIDRIRLGAVVDFISVHYYNKYYWPAFNVADSVITIGIFLMFLDIILKHKKKEVGKLSASDIN